MENEVACKLLNYTDPTVISSLITNYAVYSTVVAVQHSIVHKWSSFVEIGINLHSGQSRLYYVYNVYQSHCSLECSNVLSSITQYRNGATSKNSFELKCMNLHPEVFYTNHCTTFHNLAYLRLGGETCRSIPSESIIFNDMERSLTNFGDPLILC